VILPWPQLLPALQALFTRLSSLPVSAPPDAAQGIRAVDDVNGAGGLLLPSDTAQDQIEFAVISDVPYGDWELRQRYAADVPYPGDTYDGPGAPLGTIICEINQNKQITIQVTVSNAFQEVNAREQARAMADRLALPSALDELRAMGLALADVGEVRGPIPELDPNYKAVSKYAFEFVCNHMSYAIDAPQTTIETADFATTVDT